MKPLLKPKDMKIKRRVGKHTRRNKTRTKRGMVLDLDKVARQEVVIERDQNVCQRCGDVNGQVRSEWLGTACRTFIVIIQWCHVHTREYYITRWDPDNSLALCARCHIWFDQHKVLGFDWFAKKFPERWQMITRMLQGKSATNDAWVRELWISRCGGERQ